MMLILFNPGFALAALGLAICFLRVPPVNFTVAYTLCKPRRAALALFTVPPEILRWCPMCAPGVMLRWGLNVCTLGRSLQSLGRYALTGACYKLRCTPFRWRPSCVGKKGLYASQPISLRSPQYFKNPQSFAKCRKGAAL